MIKIMKELGKESNLTKDIYPLVEKKGRNLGRKWKARVRATLYENSSDVDGWKGKYDLFENREKSKGNWSLKSLSNFEKKDDIVNTKKNLKKSKIIFKPKDTERIGSVTQRVGQGYFRNELCERWEGKCGVTNISIPEILIASHIIPWKKSKDKERLDPGNGILLSKNLDGLFDRYLISFEDNGEIIISKKINSFDKRLLGLNEKMKLRFVKKDMIYYLREHRKVFNDLEKKNI